MKASLKRLALPFLLACMFGYLSWDTSNLDVESEYVWISGSLEERGYINLRQGVKGISLIMEGRQESFRIDPSIVRDVLKRQVPSNFTKGVSIEVLVHESKIISRSGKEKTPICWVNGLKIDHQLIFDNKDVNNWQKNNSILSYVMLLAALGYFLFSFLKEMYLVKRK